MTGARVIEGSERRRGRRPSSNGREDNVPLTRRKEMRKMGKMQKACDTRAHTLNDAEGAGYGEDGGNKTKQLNSTQLK